jgi:hypothetical protein
MTKTNQLPITHNHKSGNEKVLVTHCALKEPQTRNLLRSTSTKTNVRFRFARALFYMI